MPDIAFKEPVFPGGERWLGSIRIENGLTVGPDASSVGCTGHNRDEAGQLHLLGHQEKQVQGGSENGGVNKDHGSNQVRALNSDHHAGDSTS